MNCSLSQFLWLQTTCFQWVFLMLRYSHCAVKALRYIVISSPSTHLTTRAFIITSFLLLRQSSSPIIWNSDPLLAENGSIKTVFTRRLLPLCGSTSLAVLAPASYSSSFPVIRTDFPSKFSTEVLCSTSSMKSGSPLSGIDLRSMLTAKAQTTETFNKFMVPNFSYLQSFLFVRCN